jgi:outer membrane protein TolC
LLSRKNNTDITSQEEFIYSNNKKNNKKLDGKNIKIDHRLKKILLSPSLIANKKNIEAAKKTVLIVQSQTEPIITAISNVGPKLDNDELELDATGGLSVTKVISDGGALSAMTNSAELNVRASELLYAQNINNELMEVIKAEQAIINFRKIELIYNEQLAVYKDNLPLIQTAAKANIISKTDVLKLEQLKLKSEENYLTAKTSADAAKLIRQKYNLTDSDKFFKIYLQKWMTIEQQLTKNNFTNIQLIETQIDIIEKDIAAIDATYSANVALAGTATANVTDIDSSLGFLGLNISLPVKDGGKRNYQIQEKKNANRSSKAAKK